MVKPILAGAIRSSRRVILEDKNTTTETLLRGFGDMFFVGKVCFLLLHRLSRHKRICGRLIASQIAAASLASFFCDCRYGFTNCGAISRSVWPNVPYTRFCISRWYNARRPLSALDDRAPNEFAALWEKGRFRPLVRVP